MLRLFFYKNRRHGSERLHAIVEQVVSELLISDKALRCAEDEDMRWHAKATAVLGRLLRSSVVDNGGAMPNLVDAEARLCYAFRRSRCRQMVLRARQSIKQTIEQCVENIVRVIGKYGWFRVRRQMKQGGRAREFICSMLYLMRTGVTYQSRCILPRIEVLFIVATVMWREALFDVKLYLT